MSRWKTKLFGDSKYHFYIWIAAGLIVIVGSLWHAVRAVQAAVTDSPIGLLLLAIYFILVGQLCLGLQNYHARLAEKLDSNERRGDDNKTV
jgi:hypothetical protein